MLKVIVVILFFGQLSFAAKNKVEELFIWKMSDDLSLTYEQEKKFAEIVKQLNEKKAKISQDLETKLNTLKTAKDAKARDSALADYRKTLAQYGTLSVEEIDLMTKAFGNEKAAQYLYLKAEFTQKLKQIISNGEAEKPKTKLPPPTVIQE